MFFLTFSRYYYSKVSRYYDPHSGLRGAKGVNGKRNTIAGGQYYEQYTRQFFQQWKRGTGSLAYFDKNIYLRPKQKYLFKVNKKASNENISLGLGLIWNRFQVNNRGIRSMNRLHTMLWCFYCWLWAGQYLQVSKLNFSHWMWKHHAVWCFHIQRGKRGITQQLKVMLC